MQSIYEAIACFTLPNNRDFIARIDPRAQLTPEDTLKMLFDPQGIRILGKASL